MLHRPSDARGKFDFGWLDTAHSFSFGDYRDPRYMGFRSLRVINEDRLAAGGGFPTHGHSDMEIVTYILDGALAHKDSLGTGAVIRPGDAQRMSAGSGIEHSEFNASRTDPVHLLQIWLLPNQRGIAPGYEQKTLPIAAPGDTRLDRIASPDGGAAEVTIHSDATISRALLASGGSLAVPIARGNAWLQVARGGLSVAGQQLAQGDGLAVAEVDSLTLESDEGAEVLVFDLG
ncbi:pirin family protein [Polymorphobacter fuscus]|uniref:Pirin family protein n=2 Tax=Sandarakinorhabdus fusca TaxID=1439888 RepID=A0A7C9KXK9_9SPHN|nr:pirin family protein [Polymorphobacter fuscus]MQT17582.1 pirin family protein [Polymorphobacter fuscus]